MKKNKLIASVLAIATFATISLTSISASAAVAEVTEGLKFELKSAEETVKTIDVYYVGALTDFSNGYFKLDVTDNVTDVTFTPAFAATIDGGLADGFYSCGIATSAAVTFDNGYMGSLTLTVKEGAEDFAITMNSMYIFASYMNPVDYSGAIFYNYQGVNMGGVSDSWLDIPAFSTAGGEEEPVVINAEDAGFFTYWQNAPAAKAFYANLTAEQAAKSVTWTVTDGTPEKTKTQATTVDTTLTGENDVVIGLVVSNAVEGLTATVTVK